jgi:hypothetical protein
MSCVRIQSLENMHPTQYKKYFWGSVRLIINEKNVSMANIILPRLGIRTHFFPPNPIIPHLLMCYSVAFLFRIFCSTL